MPIFTDFFDKPLINKYLNVDKIINEFHCYKYKNCQSYYRTSYLFPLSFPKATVYPPGFGRNESGLVPEVKT